MALKKSIKKRLRAAIHLLRYYPIISQEEAKEYLDNVNEVED